MARPDLQDVEERLARVTRPRDKFAAPDQLRDLGSLVQAGEPGIALENFCTQLYEYDVTVTRELATELGALAAAMGLCVSPPLKVAP